MCLNFRDNFKRKRRPETGGNQRSTPFAKHVKIAGPLPAKPTSKLKPSENEKPRRFIPAMLWRSFLSGNHDYCSLEMSQMFPELNAFGGRFYTGKQKYDPNPREKRSR